MDSVECYSVEDDDWFEGPDLNLPRYDTSSCTLGDRVYCFGGVQGYKSYYNSIEWLDASDCLFSGTVMPSWNLIEISQKKKLDPRYGSLFCPINANELVIMGGRDQLTDLSDAWIFSCKKETVRKLVWNGPSFDCLSNQSFCVRTNTFVALIDSSGEDLLVTYTKGDTRFQVLKTISTI